MKNLKFTGIIMLAILPFASIAQINAANWIGYNSSNETLPLTATNISSALIESAEHGIKGMKPHNNNHLIWQSIDKSDSININVNPYLSFSLKLNTSSISFDRFELKGILFKGSYLKAQLRWSEDNYQSSLGDFKVSDKEIPMLLNMACLPSVKNNHVEFRIYISGQGSLIQQNASVSFRESGQYFAAIWVKDAELPISAEQFRGKISKDNTVLFKWQTAGEDDISGFIIERSLDGTNFTPIGNVSAENNTTTINKYHFTDRTVPEYFPSIFYYRLKINSTRNKGILTRAIAVVQKNTKSVISLISESNNTCVQINSIHDELVYYRITDKNKTTVLAGRYALKGGLNSFNINLNKFQPGPYTFHVKGINTNNSIGFVR